MNYSLKHLATLFIYLVGFPFNFIPLNIRFLAINLHFLFFASHRHPSESLRRAFLIRDLLDKYINNLACVLEGNGQHPKHRVTDYHNFFVENISPNSYVLDIGCGCGFVTSSVASSIPTCHITAIDYHEGNINKAIASFGRLSNVLFTFKDVFNLSPENIFDFIILSNVLEHFPDRLKLLHYLSRHFPKATLLIRVPAYDRSWDVPFRASLNIPYFLDPDHKIEYTYDLLNSELESSNYRLASSISKWGEIWAVAHHTSFTYASP
jgi:SAM-dependent methyltransferase